jgi:hypothetical protein
MRMSENHSLNFIHLIRPKTNHCGEQNDIIGYFCFLRKRKALESESY